MFQSVVQNLTGMLTVQCTCPQVGLPTHRPAGSSITTQFQGLNRSIVQSLLVRICSIGINLIQRIQTHQVRKMTMRVPVAHCVLCSILPLTQQGYILSLISKRLRLETCIQLVVEITQLRHLACCCQCSIIQGLVCTYCLVHGLTGQLLGKCRTILGTAMLRRILVRDLQCTITCRYGYILHELASRKHYREGSPQEILVQGVLVVLPQVSNVPCTQSLQA